MQRLQVLVEYVRDQHGLLCEDVVGEAPQLDEPVRVQSAELPALRQVSGLLDIILERGAVVEGLYAEYDVI